MRSGVLGEGLFDIPSRASAVVSAHSGSGHPDCLASALLVACFERSPTFPECPQLRHVASASVPPAMLLSRICRGCAPAGLPGRRSLLSSSGGPAARFGEEKGAARPVQGHATAFSDGSVAAFVTPIQRRWKAWDAAFFQVRPPRGSNTALSPSGQGRCRRLA